MISYNRRFVLHSWTIQIGSNTLKQDDEQFFAFCQTQISNNDLDFLREILEALEIMKENHGYFYIGNSRKVNQLINFLAQKISRSTSSNIPSTSSSTEIPQEPEYLGNYRWKIGYSILDECD